MNIISVVVQYIVYTGSIGQGKATLDQLGKKIGIIQW